MINQNQIFIVGANGQLGMALRTQYPNAQYADIDELDITNRNSVNNFDWNSVSIILNAAAYTDVDGSESSEGRKVAWLVNGTAVGYLTEVAQKNDLLLVHISSDYVFDGTIDPHTEDEPLTPLGVYGASKAAGDLLVNSLVKHYLLRTSWVIGEGNNFVRTMIGLGQKGTHPSVICDQIGRLTFTSELVRAIDHMLTTSPSFGTYNVTNSGASASWAEITSEIFKYAGFDLTITEVTTEQYYKDKTEFAPRPLKSTMDLSKLASTGFKHKNWREDLRNYIAKELN